jgi:hypothetical protein
LLSKNITLLLLPHQKRLFWEYDGSGSGIMIDLVGKMTLWGTMCVISFLIWAIFWDQKNQKIIAGWIKF